MNYTKIFELKPFELKGYTVISGFPGMALVGKVSVDFLIDSLKGEPVAEIYSYGSPSYILVNNGLGELPVAELYLVRDRKLAILTGNYQPLTSELQHEFSDKIVELFASKGVKRILTTAAYVSESVGEQRRVYIAANNERILKELVELGGTPMVEGGVTGLNGLVVGWAEVYGISAACMMGETVSAYAEATIADYRAAKAVLELLVKYLGIKGLDLSELDVKAKEIEEEAKKIREELVKKMLSFTEKAGRPTTYL